MEKSQLIRGARPNWYRGLKTRAQGTYFGSFASLYPNEVFVTFDKRWIVTRTKEGEVCVVQNVCAHAGMEILNQAGTQHKSEIRCSGHQWLYDMRGNLLAAPKFCKSHIELAKPKFSVWNGFILGYSKEELGALEGFGQSLGLTKDFLSAGEFIFGGEEEYAMPYPRPVMAINYKDGLHVPKYHETTFGPMVDEEKYDWEVGPNDTSCSYSIQRVYVRPNVRAHVDKLMRIHRMEQSKFTWADFHFWLEGVMPDAQTPIAKDNFAIWGMIYGEAFVMPELYLGGRFLALSYLVSMDGTDRKYRSVSYTDSDGSVCVKMEHNLYNYVEYYVHKSVPEVLRPEALEKFRFAYESSAREDDELCVKLDAAHQRTDITFDRIVHQELEHGDAHLRDWYLRHHVE